MGELKHEAFQFTFNGLLKVAFQGSRFEALNWLFDSFSGSSHKCVHDSAPAGRPRRGKRVRMRSCQLTSGAVVCRSVDGRLRGPRF